MSKKKNALPTVVISVDFEMRWGVHDIHGLDIDAYRENLENVRDVVPRMLSMFSERKLRVTWATVGALALNSWDEYFSVVTDVPKPSFSVKGVRTGTNAQIGTIGPIMLVMNTSVTVL